MRRQPSDPNIAGLRRHRGRSKAGTLEGRHARRPASSKAGKLVTRHCNPSNSKTYHGDQWVTVEVEVRGADVKHIIEGETVMQYTDSQLDEKDAGARKLIKDGDKILRGGSISLQAESHPVEFRKVEMRKLDD